MNSVNAHDFLASGWSLGFDTVAPLTDFRLDGFTEGELDDKELEDEEEEESESESEESESDVLSESVLDPELDSSSSDDDGVGARRLDRVVLVGGLDEAFPSSVLERFLGGLLVPAITTTGRELVYKES